MKSWINQINRLFIKLANPTHQRILSPQIYANYVILLLGLIGFFTLIFNVLLQLKESIYISASVFLAALVYYALNQFNSLFKFVVSSGFVMLIFIFSIYFIYNFGSEGPMFLFSFLLIYLTLFYTDKLLKYLLFLVILLDVIILYYLDHNILGFSNSYNTFLDQIIDHFLSIILVILAFVILMRSLINSQTTEKKISQESSRLKTSFLANTSHDLRAPANSILIFSELIQQEELNPKELKKYVNIIYANSSQLLNLINDIFDISVIESKTVVIIPKTININDILEDIYVNFKREIEVNNKNLDLDVHFGLPLTQSIIFSDPVRIKQILTNLIQNALKHTETGSISFGYEKKTDSNELLFFVKDTGIGIPENKTEDIFDRYVTNINKDNSKSGTGLGLHITSSIVRMLHGKIWVESSPGVGSQFFFTIPMKHPLN